MYIYTGSLAVERKKAYCRTTCALETEASTGVNIVVAMKLVEESVVMLSDEEIASGKQLTMVVKQIRYQRPDIGIRVRRRKTRKAA